MLGADRAAVSRHIEDGRQVDVETDLSQVLGRRASLRACNTGAHGSHLLGRVARRARHPLYQPALLIDQHKKRVAEPARPMDRLQPGDQPARLRVGIELPENRTTPAMRPARIARTTARGGWCPRKPVMTRSPARCEFEKAATPARPLPSEVTESVSAMHVDTTTVRVASRARARGSPIPPDEDTPLFNGMERSPATLNTDGWKGNHRPRPAHGRGAAVQGLREASGGDQPLRARDGAARRRGDPRPR